MPKCNNFYETIQYGQKFFFYDAISNFLNQKLEYYLLLKTGSLDSAIREFSLTWPSWVMSRYTMLYKYGERANNVFGAFLFQSSVFLFFSLVFMFQGRFNKSIIPPLVVNYQKNFPSMNGKYSPRGSCYILVDTHIAGSQLSTGYLFRTQRELILQ